MLIYLRQLIVSERQSPESQVAGSVGDGAKNILNGVDTSTSSTLTVLINILTHLG